MMPLIAISHRNDDTVIARALHARLASRLGEGMVFLAEQSIRGGHSWEDNLDKAFSRAAFVIAIIGRFWAADAGGNFLLTPNDFVRKELETAKRGKCRSLIPVFVEDAPVPPQKYLEAGGDAVSSLFKRQGLRLISSTVEDIQRICDHLISLIIGISGTHSEFPISRVAETINSAENRLWVWQTWTEYFKISLRKPLREFMQRYWDAHGPCRCRLLLAHPECSYAVSRAEDIAKSRLSSLLENTLVDLGSLARGIVGDNGKIGQALEVRLYKHYPSMPLYIVDEKAFVGWYPPNGTSQDSTYAEVDGPVSNFFMYVESLFREAWDQSKWTWNFQKQQAEEIEPKADSVVMPAL